MYKKLLRLKNVAIEVNRTTKYPAEKLLGK